MQTTTPVQTEQKPIHHGNDIDAVHAAALVTPGVGVQVKHELERARRGATKLVTRATQTAQAHPRATAAVLVGVGVGVGALVYRLIFPQRTAAQLIARSLKRGAAATARSLSHGFSAARNLVS